MSACLLYVKSSNKVLNSGLLSPLFHSLSLTFDHHQIAPYIFKIDLAAKSMWFFNPEIGNKSAKVVNNWNRQPDDQRFFFHESRTMMFKEEQQNVSVRDSVVCLRMLLCLPTELYW